MESPLSQEYIHIPEGDIKGQTEVLDRARPGQVSSSIQVSSSGLTDELTSNFGRSYLLRSNSVLGVLRLYGKPIESRIHSYALGEH